MAIAPEGIDEAIAEIYAAVGSRDGFMPVVRRIRRLLARNAAADPGNARKRIPFDTDARRAAQLLLPHLRRAQRLARRLECSEAQAEGASQALQALDCALLLVDRRKHVVFMSPAAERLCARGHGLQLDRQPDGRRVLRAVAGRDDDALQQALGTALRTTAPAGAAPGSQAGPPMLVHAPRADGVLVLTPVPLPRRPGSTGASHARAMLILEDPVGRHTAGERLLSSLFGLTSAECRVARALAAGEPPKVIANRLALSEHTVRTHIKALHGKTDTRGLAALAAVLARVASTRAAAFGSNRET